MHHAPVTGYNLPEAWAVSVTIRDVARRAGVSVATVSRVMSGRAPVHEHTRARVLEAAAELGWVPSDTARALAMRTSRFLGVITPDASQPFFAEVVRGIQEEAEAQGWLMLLFNSNRHMELELTYLQLMKKQHVVGCLFASIAVQPEHQAAFDRLGIPVVLVATPDPSGRLPAVIIDNVSAARLATAHLIALGHRCIGFIGLPEQDPVAGITRFRGYLDALAAAGITPDARWVRFVASGPVNLVQEGYRAAHQLLTLTPPPTAVFAAADELAVGCLGAAYDLGIRVPAELSVVGFDGLSLGEAVRPRLTTVAQPLAEYGRVAVQQLTAMLRGGAGGVVQMPYHLVVRDSAGPVPAASYAG